MLSDFLQSALPPRAPETPVRTEAALQAAAAVLSLLGLWLAYFCFLKAPGAVAALVKTRVGSAVHRLWFAGWGFDWLYDRLLVRPFVRAAEINREDFIDSAYADVADINVGLHRALSRTQTGVLRWYAMGIVLGAIGVILVAVFL